MSSFFATYSDRVHEEPLRSNMLNHIGLASVVVGQLVTTVRSVMAEGTMAVLPVEQRLDIALDLSDRYAVMDRGRIADTGRTAFALAHCSRGPSCLSNQTAEAHAWRLPEN